MKDKKAKVLFVMHMPPPVHGSTMMGQYIHDSKLINDNYECRFINESLSVSVSEVGKFRFGKLTNLYKHVRNIKNAIKEFEPDLIYTTPAGGDFSAGCIRYVFEHLAMNKAGCPKVLHIHNKGRRDITQKWYLGWYYRLLFKRAKVIFLSDLLVAQYDKWLASDQVLVCANGIPDVAGELNRKFNEKMPKILYLSNLIETKGVIVLLDALQTLKNEGLMFECNFVGAESKEIDKQRFNKEVSDRELEGMVHYLGKKFGYEKDAIYKDSNLFVFPTYYSGECFPLVLLEAMQYGLPCVSADNGAIRQIVMDGKNGYVVPQRDSETLSARIKTLLSDKLLYESFSKESRRLFKEKYSLETFESNLNKCIHETLIS